MSNQDRLLSDEELAEKIGNILDDLLNTEMPARFHNTDWAEYTITSLFNTQKRLYAESVIGEDEKSKTTKPKPLMKYIGEGDEQIVLNGGTTRTVDIAADARNELRAEQRARIK